MRSFKSDHEEGEHIFTRLPVKCDRKIANSIYRRREIIRRVEGRKDGGKIAARIFAPQARFPQPDRKFLERRLSVDFRSLRGEIKA